ncbi:MAG: class I SAM-dependent methyltransferase [bacterium]|nr:class I SAM-dependent methyltransferase [bacterium]
MEQKTNPSKCFGTPMRYVSNCIILEVIERYCPKLQARILDVGCGRGEYSQFFLQRKIQGEYLGIDLDENKASYWGRYQKEGKLSISFSLGDALKLSEFGHPSKKPKSS